MEHHALLPPADLPQMAVLILVHRVVVVARIGVVEAEDLIALRGRVPGLPLAAPAQALEAVILPFVRREEVLARPLVVEAPDGHPRILRICRSRRHGEGDRRHEGGEERQHPPPPRSWDLRLHALLPPPWADSRPCFHASACPRRLDGRSKHRCIMPFRFNGLSDF